MPHPSPRNNIWLKRNPWFARVVLPELRQQWHLYCRLSRATAARVGGIRRIPGRTLRSSRVLPAGFESDG